MSNKHAMTLMQKSAVTAASERVFGSVPVVAPPSARIAWVTAVATALLLGAAAFVVELPVRVRAEGILMPPGGLLDVLATESGVVTRVHASAGDEVAAGELLVEISAAGTNLPGKAYAEISLQSLKVERQNLVHADGLRQGMARERLEALAEQEAALARRVSLAESQLTMHAEERTLLEKRTARTASLAGAGHLSPHAAEQQQLALLQVRAKHSELRQQVLQLQSDHARLRAAAREAEAEMQLAGAEHRLQIERLEREIGKAGYQARQGIRASAESVVARVLVSHGSNVRAGQVVAKLYRPGDGLEAWLYLSSSNARLLQVGQSVRLLLDAYPKELFGTLDAEVSWVAAIALPAEQIAVPLRLSGPVFEVRARLDETDITALGRRWALPPGATFRAEVIQQRLRLYQWLLRSVADA